MPDAKVALSLRDKRREGKTAADSDQPLVHGMACSPRASCRGATGLPWPAALPEVRRWQRLPRDDCLATIGVLKETKRMNPPDFDIAAAHRHFSASCFNGVWELIDKPHRSPDEDRLMVSMCHASLYHWRQRPDCNSRGVAQLASSWVRSTRNLSTNVDEGRAFHSTERQPKVSWAFGPRLDASRATPRFRSRSDRATECCGQNRVTWRDLHPTFSSFCDP